LFGRQGARAIDVNMGTNCLQKYSFSAHCVDKMKMQVFEMQNLKVLQDSFKKSEILQILEMLHFKIIQNFRLLT
jgi:hypothetical protein